MRPSVAPPDVSPPLVLLVDDNPDTLEMYLLGLQYEGLTVTRACDGETAMASAITDRPDCIVTDLRMPRMTGFELRHRLRETSETSAIPVIALTAISAPAELATARAAGFDAVLVKPCLPEHLAREVMRLVAQSGLPRARARNARVPETQVLARAAKTRERDRATLEPHSSRLGRTKT